MNTQLQNLYYIRNAIEGEFLDHASQNCIGKEIIWVFFFLIV